MREQWAEIPKGHLEGGGEGEKERGRERERGKESEQTTDWILDTKNWVSQACSRGGDRSMASSESLGYTARPHPQKVKTKQKNRMSRHPSQDSWLLFSLTLYLRHQLPQTQIPHGSPRHTSWKPSTRNDNHQHRKTLGKQSQGQLEHLGFEWLHGCRRDWQSCKESIPTIHWWTWRQRLRALTMKPRQPVSI